MLKRCTEKSYSRMLAKLFLVHGKQLTVSDVCNTYLYPYHRQEFYGNHSKATVKNVKPPVSGEKPWHWLTIFILV
ncbi:hypothetical protein GH742_03245 [Legionella sp. MW5194]|uniref:hypothetical protein n=1 Tax=Legionella sp. MW5194 TaxID=2662448 RepID=UPI00193CE0B4|nr:hypothetical protein [Legionella sp. MW5194]QRN02960.1 hypothetical protein GH742_03245 [Legionella sp. MW5194]